ncbi:MAG: hypothetical protein GX601_11700 [Anaerolineales bacterium]|nr:hypothetical protein [Anaerolineales bacterium]
MQTVTAISQFVQRVSIHKVRSVRPGLWILPTLLFIALYTWRPFTLGFYSDDWSNLVESTRYGAPFSLERLLRFMEVVPYARPLQIVEQYVASSLFGSSAVAWHLGLIALVAVSCWALHRFLVALGADSRVATSTCALWLVFPWALGYRAWPIAVPILLSVICFLSGSTALLRLRAWPAVAWYTAGMLIYEAFYFQFAVILAIRLASADTRRWALRQALAPLFLVQVMLIVGNRWAASVQPHMAKQFDDTWMVTLLSEFVHLPVNMAGAVVTGRWLALGLVISLFVVFGVLALRAKERSRRVALLAVSLGVVLSLVVLVIAGYYLYPVGHFSRTFVAVNVWMTAFMALAWGRTPSRRWLRLAMKGSVALVLIVFAVSTLLQTVTWHEWWQEEKAILATVPVDALRQIDPGAVILTVGIPNVAGLPVFGDTWGLSAAVANEVPATRTETGGYRIFTPSRPGETPRLDRQLLAKLNFVDDRESGELWLWQWPGRTLRPITAAQMLSSSGQLLY